MIGIIVFCVLTPVVSRTADHNDPNAVNSIFWDVPQNAADLYDLFGFPSDDRSGGIERVVVALTFAAEPKAGEFDTDLLYRVLFAPNPRVVAPMGSDRSLQALLRYFDSLRDKYLRLQPSEVRVRFPGSRRATIDFIDFPGGSLSQTIDTDAAVELKAPDGSVIKVFIGGRDDAFFNDLPGFFRSINYGPQFYKVPRAMTDARELRIPKTLLELEGNTLFNFDPANPTHGMGLKMDLPAGPLAWSGNAFKKDANGNYRFVYSGQDAQAGRNINTIIMELPLTFITKAPQENRIVNTWGESWVLKASGKINTIPDDGAMLPLSRLAENARLLGGIAGGLGVILLLYGVFGSRPASPRQPLLARKAVRVAGGVVLVAAGVGLVWLHETRPGQQGELARASMADELRNYKLVDTDGQPFADAGLNERDDARQVGANNFWLGPRFVLRLAHLGWGFAPSVSALGLKSSFDHDNSPVSVYRTYDAADIGSAFLKVQKMLFQPMTMPDDTWRKGRSDIPVRHAYEVFIPNVCAIDMDTSGSWPFGRRLEDQVATRFLSIFLDMDAEFNGAKYTIDTLSNQAALDTLPLEPKVPPNPLKNDREFLDRFPYLADPWPESYSPAPR